MFAGRIGSRAPEFSPTRPAMVSIPAPPAFPAPPPDPPPPNPALASPALPAPEFLELEAFPFPEVPFDDPVPVPPPTGEIERAAQRLPAGRASTDAVSDGSVPITTSALPSLPPGSKPSADASDSGL